MVNADANAPTDEVVFVDIFEGANTGANAAIRPCREGWGFII